jgi:hypothetical protein
MTDLSGAKDGPPNPGKNGNGASDTKRHWLDNLAVIAAAGAAVAAAAAAGVGLYQAGIAKDTEQRQLRAYVGIAQHGIENFGRSDQILRTTRKNYGLTPAYDVLPVQATIDVIRIGTNLPHFFNTNYPAGQQAITMFPGAELKFDWRGNTLSMQQIALAVAGTEYQAAIWGIVFYKDAFGAPHYTRFCWLYHGEHMTENDADTCLGHNDSD